MRTILGLSLGLSASLACVSMDFREPGPSVPREEWQALNPDCSALLAHNTASTVLVSGAEGAPDKLVLEAPSESCIAERMAVEPLLADDRLSQIMRGRVMVQSATPPIWTTNADPAPHPDLDPAAADPAPHPDLDD